MSTAVVEPVAEQTPGTPREAEPILRSWSHGLRSEGQRSPLQIQVDDETLTLRADLEALWKRHASIELQDDRLCLRIQSKRFALNLARLDSTALCKDKWFSVSLRRRSATDIWKSVLMASQSAEPMHRELISDVARFVTESQDSFRVALLNRVFGAVSDVAETVEHETAVEALSARSNLLAVIRLLEQPEMLEMVKHEDPLAPARLRGVEARQKLVELGGGTLSGEDLSRALGLTRQAIDKRRRAGRLLALSVGKRGYRYPSFQLADGHLLAGIEQVLGALKEHDAWTQLAFFVNRQPGLSDRTPIELLRSREVDAVIGAAANVDEQGAA